MSFFEAAIALFFPRCRVRSSRSASNSRCGAIQLQIAGKIREAFKILFERASGRFNFLRWIFVFRHYDKPLPSA